MMPSVPIRLLSENVNPLELSKRFDPLMSSIEALLQHDLVQDITLGAINPHSLHVPKPFLICQLYGHPREDHLRVTGYVLGVWQDYFIRCALSDEPVLRAFITAHYGMRSAK